MSIYVNTTDKPQLIYDYLRRTFVVPPGGSQEYISDTDAVVSDLVSAPIIQGNRVSLAQGVSTVTVSFTQSFPAGYIPSVTITVQGTPNVFAALQSVSNTGFVATLSASVANANYVLNWSAT